MPAHSRAFMELCCQASAVPGPRRVRSAGPRARRSGERGLTVRVSACVILTLCIGFGCLWVLVTLLCDRGAYRDAECRACDVTAAGPKTLCNACGVKLVRANAKQKDGLKRRAAAAGGASTLGGSGGHGGSGPRAVAPAPAARPAVLPKPEAGSPASVGGVARARNSALAEARRPQRKVHTPRRPAALGAERVVFCLSDV